MISLNPTKLEQAAIFLGGQGHHAETGLFDQGDVFQQGIGFHLFEGDGVGERTEGAQLHADPLTFLGGGVWKGFFGNRGLADDFFADNTMIKQNPISCFHGRKIVAGLEVTDSCPRCGAIPDEVLPRVGGGFLFNEPMFH